MTSYSEQDEWAALRAYASQGDPQAFEVLVHRYQAMVYTTCRRQLGNTTDAEDATQETFLKLARKAGAIRSSLSAWLHTCAVGTSRDLIRRQATRRKHEQEAGQAVTASSKDATWDQLGPVIDDALQSLPKHQRDLLVERFLVGVPQTQIAEREGVSPSAVHQRINRAVESLRKKLSRKGISVAAVALGTLMSGAAQAAVPQTVTASAMKIGLAGVAQDPSGSIVSILIEQFMEASLMTKLTTTAAAVALIAGTTVTVSQLRSASPAPTQSTPRTTTAAPMAAQPGANMQGNWENTGWLQDNQPAMSVTTKGRHLQLEVPSFIPGGDRMKMTLEIMQTDPEASPGKIVYKLIESNSPMIPVTGEPVNASYAVDESQFFLAVNMMGGPRPDSLEQVPGRWVLACRKSSTEESQATMDEGLDPALAGRWIGYIPMHMEIKDGAVVNRTPTGAVLSELEIIRWDDKSNPKRLEAVITTSNEMPQLVGKTVKSIYEVRGDWARYAHYDFTSPKFGQWPRNFKGRKGDNMNTTSWQRLESE